MTDISSEGAPEGVRLQKVLAQAGVGSRRHCEDLIEAGRVSIDGQVVDQLGVRVVVEGVAVTVDGKRISVDESIVTVVLNKPKGVVSTMSDPEGRPSLQDYVGDRNARLFHVGRLDTDTSGLLILTNDGDLAHKLAHPSFVITKTYVALVDGDVPDTLGAQLRSGIELDDGPAKVDRFQVKDRSRGRSIVELDIHMGRNRIVRRMLDAAGHPVIDLVRTQFGPVRLGTLAPGESRQLGPAEIGKLMQAAGL